jgi:hypothetical protein
VLWNELRRSLAVATSALAGSPQVTNTQPIAAMRRLNRRMQMDVGRILAYFTFRRLLDAVEVLDMTDCEARWRANLKWRDVIASDVGLRRPVVEGAGPQMPAGPVGADDDTRRRCLRADEREFAWRSSIRKKTFARA